jgi:hypothetical protein
MRSDVSRTIVLGAMGTPRSTFPAAPREAQRARRGGARRDRTDDLMLAKHALSQLSYGPVLEDECFCCARLRWRYGAAAFVQEACRAEAAEQRRLVGLGRLELPTSRLSSARSNQLSYKPLTLILKRIGNLLARCRLDAGWSAQAQPLARVRPRRKRNEDGEIPPMELNDLAIVGP